MAKDRTAIPDARRSLQPRGPSHTDLFRLTHLRYNTIYALSPNQVRVSETANILRWSP